uniref:C2H2-type domain-containing protein n=1 Tax=Schistocephalus solidus TaxID=70667 RepID=A0A0V0J6C7_SCHSO
MLSKDCEKVPLFLQKKTLDLFYQCKNNYAPECCTDDEFVHTMLLQFQKCPNPSHPTEFVCPECDYVAGTMSDISAHFDTKHSVEASFSCTCGSSYDRMPDFLRHYIKCPIAATDLQDPTHSKASDPPKAQKGDTTTSESSPENAETDGVNFFSTYRHPPVVPIKGPSNEKPFGCPQCPKGFKSKSLLEQHMHLHYPPRYKCRWCGKVYRWPPVYYHHMRICKKLPSSKSNHLPHPAVESIPKAEIAESSPLELAHSTPNVPPTPPPPPPPPPPLSLAKKPRLATAPAADTSEKLPPVPVSPFMCFCNSVFSDIQSYFAHVSNCSQVLKTLRGRYSNLPITDFPPLSSSFDSKFSLPLKPELQSPEPRISHRSSKVFVCNICSKGFTSKLSLKQHVDGKHRAEGKYVCQVCGKRYRWGASFYYHRRTCISTALPKANNTSDVPSLPHHISQPSA